MEIGLLVEAVWLGGEATARSGTIRGGCRQSITSSTKSKVRYSIGAKGPEREAVMGRARRDRRGMDTVVAAETIAI